MSNTRTFDHLFNGRFRVEIDGIALASFSQCDGLEASVDVVEFTDGTDTLQRKRPGRARYANIVLRHGHVNNDELWNWFKAGADGQVQRKSGSVIVCDDNSVDLFRFNFFEAWPCRWKSLELNADRPGSLVERIEIAVEKIERG